MKRKQPLRNGKNKVAVLGPKNTYSDLALRAYNSRLEALYLPSISEVFEAVLKGRVREGLVPLENSASGSVRETLDELFETGIPISAVIAQPIHLSLIGKKPLKLGKINVVYSHEQALLQTKQFCRKYLPQAVRIPTSSTSTALHHVQRGDQEGVVAIGAPEAARDLGLKVIKDGIADDPSNTTYFALISKHPNPSRATRTSIAFTFSKDSPGSLYSVLKDFADDHINLTKIESRPNPKMRGQYVFYIDFEGDAKKPVIQKVLRSVKGRVSELKILGSYLIQF